MTKGKRLAENIQRVKVSAEHLLPVSNQINDMVSMNHQKIPQSHLNNCAAVAKNEEALPLSLLDNMYLRPNRYVFCHQIFMCERYFYWYSPHLTVHSSLDIFISETTDESHASFSSLIYTPFTQRKQSACSITRSFLLLSK